MNNNKDILTLWKKTSKAGSTFYSGLFTWAGETKEVVIFLGNGGDERKPYIKMIESEPREPAMAQPTNPPVKEIQVEDIPF